MLNTDTEKKNEKRALIAMSGGVDSSVAACLMVENGYECIGCTMKLYDNEDIQIDRSNTCCSLDDVEDARSVATGLGMKYYVFNFKDDFREKVIDKFVHCYEQGITPNPCIDCNRHMKFDRLFERAKTLGYNYVVTGHYACVEKDEATGKYLLRKSVDPSKDQSYVLYQMTQEQLAHTMFPLGKMAKTETRKIADAHGFINANKPDSQDICFVPDGDYASVIEGFTGRTYEPGDFLDMEGNVLGRHKGIIHYTIGQRKGLGLALKQPMYVGKIDVKNNAVVLCTNDELFAREVYVRDFHWISEEAPEEAVRGQAKIRYRHNEQPCTVTALSGEELDAELDFLGIDKALKGTEEASIVKIVFDEPQRAATPGQSAVVYDGDIVLGGGIIYLK